MTTAALCPALALAAAVGASTAVLMAQLLGAERAAYRPSAKSSRARTFR